VTDFFFPSHAWCVFDSQVSLLNVFECSVLTDEQRLF